jgi:hypothetical protein
MGVPFVIAVLIVDRGDITRHAASQLFRECPRQRLALLWCGFHRKGDYKPLAHAPLALLRGVLGIFRCCGVRLPCQPLTQHAARGLRSGDIAQVCYRLPRLGDPGLGGPLLGKCFHRMPE